jgi:hypothetical protein
LRHKFAIDAFPGLAENPARNRAFCGENKPGGSGKLKTVKLGHIVSLVFNSAHIVVVSFRIKPETQTKIASMPADLLQLFHRSVGFDDCPCTAAIRRCAADAENCKSLFFYYPVIHFIDPRDQQCKSERGIEFQVGFRLPRILRRNTVHSLECHGKSICRIVAIFHGDIQNTLICVLKLAGRTGQTSAPYVLGQRYPCNRTKRALKHGIRTRHDPADFFGINFIR